MAPIEKRRRETDLSGLCAPELSPQDREDLERGVVLFNRGQYWDSHEAWERVWQRHPENSRIFFQGLIQVAAGLHQLQRGILHGCDKHFRNALWKLRPFQPDCLGLDVAGLVRAVEKLLERALSLGADNLGEIAPTLFPTLKSRQ
ncbi:MAG: DUF309 domain-containing protein [bacterium]